MKIFLIAGARPNFMKIAPIVRALKQAARPGLEWKLVHTGQHYDHSMSQSFFEDLGIPEPDYHLQAGSGSHAVQTARIMTAFEDLCEQDRPDVVLVVGDVNSTLACSIVAKKLGIKVAHVEAGLRSFDLSMPEEINRMVTDSITDYFFTTEEAANQNLLKEGKAAASIHYVGHVMIDNLLFQKRLVDADGAFESAALKRELGPYIFLTLHRPATVDDPVKLAEVIAALNQIAEETPIVFPVHPRTRKMIAEFSLQLSERIIQFAPLGFKESLFWWQDALLVLTDSGGLQEETTALGVPCYTVRENTERPITVTEGTNSLIGVSGAAILEAYADFRAGKVKQGRIPKFWDGRAAERIVEVLLNESN